MNGVHHFVMAGERRSPESRLPWTMAVLRLTGRAFASFLMFRVWRPGNRGLAAFM